MSSFPSRTLETWKSSLAETIGEISGVFCFHLYPSIMVSQTCQFLFENQGSTVKNAHFINGFIVGMRYYNPTKPLDLYWCKNFSSAEQLFNFDYDILSQAIRQLELHTDINLYFNQITYLADTGTGPNTPLMIIKRVPFRRGVAFEDEERGLVNISISQGDFDTSDKIKVAQQHYSTGMGLLSGEDALTGLIDAAFMQFYLCLEALLENHEEKKAIKFASSTYGKKVDSNLIQIIEHVYLARHRFFGHAHPKYLKGILDSDTAFDIAKQTLVARWAARNILELELGRKLVKREIRLYSAPNHSVYFNGDATLIKGEFKLPEA